VIGLRKTYPGGVEAVRGIDPDVVFRIDGGSIAPRARPPLVGAAAGRPFAVISFTVRNGRIAEIDVIADPDKLRGLSVGA
jgi:hypothetical protein